MFNAGTVAESMQLMLPKDISLSVQISSISQVELNLLEFKTNILQALAAEQINTDRRHLSSHKPRLLTTLLSNPIFQLLTLTANPIAESRYLVISMGTTTNTINQKQAQSVLSMRVATSITNMKWKADTLIILSGAMVTKWAQISQITTRCPNPTNPTTIPVRVISPI